MLQEYSGQNQEEVIYYQTKYIIIFFILLQTTTNDFSIQVTRPFPCPAVTK